MAFSSGIVPVLADATIYVLLVVVGHSGDAPDRRSGSRGLTAALRCVKSGAERGSNAQVKIRGHL
jgi:hypothetical protein